MPTSAAEWAQRFERTNDEFMSLVERLTAEQWSARCAEEGWTVGEAACHLAEDHTILADFVQLIAEGKPLPDFTVDAVHQMNADQAERNAGCKKEHVLQLLRANGAAAAAVVGGLTDAQLDSAINVPASHPFRVLDNLPERLTPPMAIEAGLIGHFREHGSSILAAAFPALAMAPKAKESVAA